MLNHSCNSVLWGVFGFLRLFCIPLYHRFIIFEYLDRSIYACFLSLLQFCYPHLTCFQVESNPHCNAVRLVFLRAW
jgi:hypothetical protein